MGYKFFYLYLVGGTIALLLFTYQLVAYYPSLNTSGVAINAVIIVLLFYMAYKVRREKEDKDMM
jgi:hypothetical protein